MKRHPALMGWLRAGARVVVMLVWLGLCLAGLGLDTLRGATRPSPWSRRFLSGIARIAGVRIVQIGAPQPGGMVLVANHISWIDIPAIAACSDAAFVAHDGLAEVPLIAWLCSLHQTVFVARGHRSSVAAQITHVRDALASQPVLALFPEGTTSDGTALLRFKSSLLAAFDPLPPGLSIQPVWLDYGPDCQDIAWIGVEHGAANFLRIAARAHPMEVRVHFLTPLAGKALAGRKAMATAARGAINAALTRG